MLKSVTKISPFRSGKIYILPTKFGVAYVFGLLAMFLAAASYANNLVYLLTFVVFSVMIASLISTNYNLKGITIGSIEVASNHVNEELEFVVYVTARSREPKFGLSVKIRADGIREVADARVPVLRENEQVAVSVKAKGVERGRFMLRRVLLESVYPIGLWRSWSYIEEDREFFVYPERSGSQSLPDPVILIEGVEGRGGGMDDFSEHRSFQFGDSYRHVDWRARARGLPLLVKQFSSGEMGLRLLDWNDVRLADAEEKLKQLSDWIDRCHGLHEPYGVSLPGTSIPPSVGKRHYQRCQESLAQFGGAYDRAS